MKSRRTGQAKKDALPSRFPRLRSRSEAARLAMEDKPRVVAADDGAEGAEVELIQHVVGESLDDVFDHVLDEEAHHINHHVNHNLEDPVQSTKTMDIHADVAEEKRKKEITNLQLRGC